ncbi:DUF4174 domain-containing protein [Paracoccus gahaiensis]|uniref:DUF4174 domain-containing protein n=1 Tax=Paracoccus gahaiensis TaxID=1706839 RepID=A0A4U0REB6_9RHOB|nr:DUF4174 domain-containing protein [Paracoccus gahaiensis]TJZ93763.1 DUF4174 domain-containing protein [Paracoccus gahaiensis]
MRFCLTAAMAFWPVMAPADTGRGAGLPVAALQTDTLAQLRWQARPVVVLGEEGPVADQIARMRAASGALAEREVTLLTDGPGAEDLRPAAGLRVLLIGKDGGIKLDRDGPVTPDEIIALIDSMPMRRREAD